MFFIQVSHDTEVIESVQLLEDGLEMAVCQ